MKLLAQEAGLLGVELNPGQLAQFQTYQRALASYPANLTSARALEEAETRHFLESIAIGKAMADHGVLAWGEPASLLDLGAGAGFPGLPLKIVNPQLRVTLLEATGKKARFLRSLLQDLDIAGVLVLEERAEAAAHDPLHRGRYDLVTARAVAALPALAELALPFLRLGGHLAAAKGSRVYQEMEDARRALEICGGEPAGVRALDVPGEETAPVVVFVRKASLTPDQYPRRPGVPAKRPLR